MSLSCVPGFKGVRYHIQATVKFKRNRHFAICVCVRVHRCAYVGDCRNQTKESDTLELKWQAVTGSCEPPIVWWEPNSSPLKRNECSQLVINLSSFPKVQFIPFVCLLCFDGLTMEPWLAWACCVDQAITTLKEIYLPLLLGCWD